MLLLSVHAGERKEHGRSRNGLTCLVSAAVFDVNSTHAMCLEQLHHASSCVGLSSLQLIQLGAFKMPLVSKSLFLSRSPKAVSTHWRNRVLQGRAVSVVSIKCSYQWQAGRARQSRCLRLYQLFLQLCNSASCVHFSQHQSWTMTRKQSGIRKACAMIQERLCVHRSQLFCWNRGQTSLTDMSRSVQALSIMWPCQCDIVPLHALHNCFGHSLSVSMQLIACSGKL